MQILFVASEGVPFVKTGGLADVIGSLPKALIDQGDEVRVVMPKYKGISAHFKKKMILKKRLTINLGWRNLYCGVEELKHEGIHYYFIDNEYYFKRDGLYGYSDSLDEAERFAFFSKAVLEALPYLDFKPEILHLHDWQTGLVSLFLKTMYHNQDFYNNIRTVFTIHNLKYQGVFPKRIVGDILDYNIQYLTSEGIEYYGRVSYIKAGLVFSDYITTVSEAYAQEIQYPYYGFGLDGLLRKRSRDLFGILNGIDLELYNPENDPEIFVKYTTPQAKLQNKLLLQDLLKLPVNKEIPMIGMVSRLVPEKGLDLVVGVLEDILAENLQLVVLGTGEQKFLHALGETAYRHQDKMSATFAFDEGLSRKIYAAADLFLMPSQFEPCGISQLIAFRYEAVPIVRETGGLKDSVIPFNEFTGEGVGFSFANYNEHDMLFTIRRALGLYHDKVQWDKIIQNIQRGNYGWNDSAKKYHQIYQQLLRQGDERDVRKQRVI